MQGNIVTAAKWLGASLVLASVILVGRLHWVMSSHAGRPITPMPTPRVEATSTTPAARVDKPLTESEAPRQGGDDTNHTAAPDTQPEGALLRVAEVIRIAKQAAERQGVGIRGHKDPVARYEFKDKSWDVYFEGRVAKPGYFSISRLTIKTGKTHLEKGE